MKVFLIKLPNEKGGIFMWHSSSVEEVSKNLKTNVNIGLSEDEAQKRFERYGPNNLKEKKKESIFVKFIKQFNDFMIITLIIVLGVFWLVPKIAISLVGSGFDASTSATTGLVQSLKKTVTKR